MVFGSASSVSSMIKKKKKIKKLGSWCIHTQNKPLKKKILNRTATIPIKYFLGCVANRRYLGERLTEGVCVRIINHPSRIMKFLFRFFFPFFFLFFFPLRRFAHNLPFVRSFILFSKPVTKSQGWKPQSWKKEEKKNISKQDCKFHPFTKLRCRPNHQKRLSR